MLGKLSHIVVTAALSIWAASFPAMIAGAIEPDGQRLREPSGFTEVPAAPTRPMQPVVRPAGHFAPKAAPGNPSSKPLVDPRNSPSISKAGGSRPAASGSDADNSNADSPATGGTVAHRANANDSAATDPAPAAAKEADAAATDATGIEIMSVDEVKPGMVGIGKTVLEGTEPVEFKARILGVLRRVSPGRDIVLCRLSGANLEYTGVIAGMSGSPIYIDGKLLGAIAYTWPFNKEPIAGITPFEQMRSFAESATACDDRCTLTAEGSMPVETLDLVGFTHPATNDGSKRSTPAAADRLSLNRSNSAVAARPAEMQPIALPLSASGFGPRTIEEMRRRLQPLGLLPIAGGSGGQKPKFDPQTVEKHPLKPGGVLAASLVTGDFDLSGIGTVTHVAGKRVWGWGHPFMSGGRCQYMLRNGRIHIVNPKQDVSTKMGVSEDILGVIDADVSTCIAGTLGQQPDLMPMSIVLQYGEHGKQQRYACQVVRHPKLLAPLVATVLAGALESGGNLDQEITVDMNAVIRPEGLEPITIQDRYSGHDMAGSRGVQRLLNQVAVIADGLTRNPFQTVRVQSIECRLVIMPRRTSAAVTSLRLNSDVFEPGETLRAEVTLRPYKSAPVTMNLEMQLHDSLPPGQYTATVCDATVHLKNVFLEQPRLLIARSLGEIVNVYRLQLSEKRSTLFLRILTHESGLSIGEVNLPNLPASMRAALTSKRASPAHPIRKAHVVRKPTSWVIEGTSSLPFKVVARKQVSG